MEEDIISMTPDTTEVVLDMKNKDVTRIPSGIDIVLGGTAEQRKELFAAMSKYFGEVCNPENTTVNSFFGKKYAPLSEVLKTVRPIMSKYGLCCTQSVSNENGECQVSTMLLHMSGGYIVYPTLKGKPTKSDIQGVGAALTYLRRYSLGSVAGVCGEIDDDGNSIARNDAQKPKRRQPKVKEDNIQAETIKSKVEALTASGVDRESISTAIKTAAGTANYNKITDPNITKSVIEELEKLEVE